MGDKYYDVCSDAELTPGQSRAESIDGFAVYLCNSDNVLYAIQNQCTHAESTFIGGRLRRNTISCPLHGARFDLATGKCLGGAYKPLKTYPIRVTAGRIEVALPQRSAGPGMESSNASGVAGKTRS